MKIYFFDTETTGNTHEDRIVQLAIKERGNPTPLINELFKPPMPIPFESSAVHHISNRMVANKPLFQESPRYLEIKEIFESPETIVVAHNSAFDVTMLTTEGIHPTNVICTYKTIRHIDIETKFTNYKLQYLRYALDMELDVGAHDAMADVIVLEKLFEYLLESIKSSGKSEEEALTEMITLTKEPAFMREFSFGKHKGMRVEEVAKIDPGYLSWLLSEKLKNPIGEEDWIFTLQKYLGK
jgi:DNA polymerase III epsilon subunit-like protein